MGQAEQWDRKVQVVDLRGRVVRSWSTPDEVLDLRVLASGLLATIGNKELALSDPIDGRVLAKRAQKPALQSPAIADVRGNLILTRGPARLFTVA
jgi:hypothetical protein